MFQNNDADGRRAHAQVSPSDCASIAVSEEQNALHLAELLGAEQQTQ